jgi:hypothetical protein
MKGIVAAALLSFASYNAQAVVMGFNSDPSFHFGNGNPYQESGFQISNSTNNSDGLLFWGNDPFWTSMNADPGGNTLSHNYTGSTMTLSKLDNSLFTFNSIDLADVYNNVFGNRTPIHVVFNFLFDDLSTNQMAVDLDTQPGLQTFTFNQSNLKQVSWTPEQAWLQLDDIVLDAPANVPTPAPVWLIVSGLFGFAGIKRKQKITVAAAN